VKDILFVFVDVVVVVSICLDTRFKAGSSNISKRNGDFSKEKAREKRVMKG